MFVSENIEQLTTEKNNLEKEIKSLEKKINCMFTFG